MGQPSFVLIHSPLLGPLTWQSVARILHEQGRDVFTPELIDNPQSDLPMWQQEVNSLDLPVTDVVLVGHSGAGALLPALGKRLAVHGYIFVVAVLLFQSATRLELLRSEDIEFAQEFAHALEAGGTYPNWRDEHLQALISDADLRQKLLADMRPRSLSFFTERIDVPTSWDTKPCAYFQLSEGYRSYASQAETRGWIVVRRSTHHFEMLTQPLEIAHLLVHLYEQLLD
jgi:hypothetical protein